MQWPSSGFLAFDLWLVSAISAATILTLLVRGRGRVTDVQPAGPQHIHVDYTSRLGGVAVSLGFVFAVAIALHIDFGPLRPALLLLFASLPVYAVGVYEDITRRVSPRKRLLAAVVSAALASVIAQGVIVRLDLPILDGWLAFMPFAVPLTWFMVAGACNALNIIDGTNGLAGGSALLMFAGMAAVAWNVGDTLVLLQAAAMTGALLGFLIWNYPKGKVFLGDGGAYFVGFMYAELSIQIVGRNAAVSAWFVIAMAAYPIVETLFSIYRRKVTLRAAAMQPDLQHLHSLIYVSILRTAERPPLIERRASRVTGPYRGKERRQSQRRANAQVAPHLWLHGLLCLAIALLFYDSTPLLIIFTLAYGIFYVTCYRDAERRSRGDKTIERRAVPSARP